MDFNDINLRLKRLYNAIGKQYEYDLNANVKRFVERSGTTVKMGVRFGNHSETELNNRVFGIVNAIASLKDHLKSKLETEGKNPKDVEDMIDESLELQLVVDLWNQDKHGYPLTKHKRSHKNPKIINIRQGLTMTGGTEASVWFQPSTGKISSTGNTVIKISGDIVDEQGIVIASLDKMVEVSVEKIEQLVKDNNLL